MCLIIYLLFVNLLEIFVLGPIESVLIVLIASLLFLYLSLILLYLFGIISLSFFFRICCCCKFLPNFTDFWFLSYKLSTNFCCCIIYYFCSCFPSSSATLLAFIFEPSIKSTTSQFHHLGVQLYFLIICYF